MRHLSQVEDVHLLVEDGVAEQRVRNLLGRTGTQLGRVHFHQWPTNRIWLRDSGPIFLTRHAHEDSPVAITNWRFNAWAKYNDWQLDDQLPLKAAELLHVPSWTPVFPIGHRVVLEGGSIDVNGQGTLITTEECLLSAVQPVSYTHLNVTQSAIGDKRGLWTTVIAAAILIFE